MSFIKASSALAFGLFALRASAGAADASPASTCESYGVDFQDGGVYFQNASSTDDFSFISFFENCENDVAYNILVDPNGDEYECGNTNLQPDDTNQLATCPLQKDQMWSGGWSVVIISNNGEDGDPIAYERDFGLVVALPKTVTYTPTITVTSTSIPVTSVTTTTTTTSTTTSVIPTTLPANTKKPTTTITPAAVTTTKIWTLGTVKTTQFVVNPIVQTTTVTQTCSLSSQSSPDPSLTWTPSLLPSAVASSFTASSASGSTSGSASATTTAPAVRRDTLMSRRIPADRAARIAARKERLAAAGLDKRGLDVFKTTVTDSNTADFFTITSTFVAPTSTATLTSIVTQIQTVTSITTILSGTTTLPLVSTTLPTPTKTSLKPTVVTSTATVTKSPTYVITIHTAPASASQICSAKGGQMAG